ncbi:TetR/AcrR family transcriptional regulator [Actinomadura sp. 3N407]|uniref:TetR/AcrR family transcriptional regulator n=1 Tax=Actinomadura sp. 3N407 TaxID=3457423 RepID=UPI003FCC9BE1
MPRKRPRQQRSQFTVEAILEAAAQLFQRYGYAATTTNKIAERAGVSIGSLYQYFPNKDAVLYLLGERHVQDMEKTLTAVLADLRITEPPLEPTVRTLVTALTDIHRTEPAMHRLLFDQAPRPPSGARRLRQIENAMAAEVEYHMRRLTVGEPDPHLTAVLLVQAVEAQVHGAVLDPPPGRTMDDCIDAIVDLCLRALRT